MRQVAEAAHLDIDNIGGIDDTDVTFEPGVTVLAGRNATNRTSLLQALMAALGSEDVSLKADADEGYVELELDGEQYRRRLVRQGSGVAFDGDPYLDDPTLGNLFAFLIETNDARRAVVRRKNLYEIMMRPVDTESIEHQISSLQAERNRIDDDLESIDDEKRRLPEHERKRTELSEEIEAKRDELKAVESEIDDADADPEKRREEKDKLESKLGDLRERRSDLEDVRYSVETERESIGSLQDERAELQSELKGLPENISGDLDDIDGQVGDLRREKRELESEITDLQNVIQFNDEVLEGDGGIVSRDDDGEVTDQLLPDDEVVCWTCGSDVERDRIEETMERLRDRLEEMLSQSRDIESRIDQLADERERLNDQRDRREAVLDRLDRIEDEIEERNDRIDTLTQRREELSAEVETLESGVEELESADFEEILDLHRRANQHEFEIERIEKEREEVETEIETIEERLEDAERLQDRREEVSEELEELRTRVDRLEREAVEAFNEHMDTILDILDYANVDRIWIERTDRTVEQGRGTTTESDFELHVVRQTESGTTYEDRIEHLSESEREVTGLVFALAGYLVHEVHETVPFMLLDSVEAIDSRRLGALIDHLQQYTDYLIVALLEEDAQAIQSSGVDASITDF